jgi:hypothetical protein
MEAVECVEGSSLRSAKLRSLPRLGSDILHNRLDKQSKTKNREKRLVQKRKNHSELNVKMEKLQNKKDDSFT